MTNIYILQLEHGCYYVGKTNDVQKRYKEHLSGNGSAWTRKHKPIKIINIIQNASDYDEDRYVKEYMGIYGINKVRGGAYVNIELNDTDKKSILRELRNAKNQCLRCGSPNHFVKDCKKKTINKIDKQNDDKIIEDDYIIIDQDQNINEQNHEQHNNNLWYLKSVTTSLYKLFNIKS